MRLGGEVCGDPAVQPLDPHLVPLLGREFGGGGLGSTLGWQQDCMDGGF